MILTQKISILNTLKQKGFEQLSEIGVAINGTIGIIVTNCNEPDDIQFCALNVAEINACVANVLRTDGKSAIVEISIGENHCGCYKQIGIPVKYNVVDWLDENLDGEFYRVAVMKGDKYKVLSYDSENPFKLYNVWRVMYQTKNVVIEQTNELA